MHLDPELLNTNLRLKTLQTPGVDMDARIEQAGGRRVMVAVKHALEIGAMVRLEGSTAYLFGEVIGTERTSQGVIALLDVHQCLCLSDLEIARSLFLDGKPEARNAVAGN